MWNVIVIHVRYMYNNRNISSYQYETPLEFQAIYSTRTVLYILNASHAY
jgi:hypothetical protein